MTLSLAPPVRITKNDLGLFAGFRCGNEPYQKALADWIATDAAKAIKDKTRVFAYVTSDKPYQVVGYGSLGKTRWQLTKEDGQQDPEEKVRVQIIPALAVHEDFQGHGISYVIVNHLIQEAKLLIDVSPLLGLYVHEKNAAAIHVYTKVGFHFVDGLEHADETGRNLGMVYELAVQ
jgi:GNAT superfamily N-acetyltransferase